LKQCSRGDHLLRWRLIHERSLGRGVVMGSSILMILSFVALSLRMTDSIVAAVM
jgi:hypothetical protein